MSQYASPLPTTAIGLDPYGFATAHLSQPALAALDNLRAVLDRDVVPLMGHAWDTASLPAGILDTLIPLNLMTPHGVDPQEAGSSMFSGFRNYVLARADVSVATLYNAQSGLFRATITHGGSPQQAATLDPRISSFDLTGCFALTEPDHGSDVAGGMETTASRSGDTWTINGAKRWIGAADSMDVHAVFARDTADNHVKCFIVPRTAPGVSYQIITGKVALRPMQNSTITYSNVTVSESDRLQRVNSWRDVARILRVMRSDVAWIATGLQAGALDATLRYVTSRQQFGRPLAGFQLIQEKVARMYGNLLSSLGIVTRLSAMQDQGQYADENSAIAKMQTALLARETAALGREVAGGNGILLENDIARFFADAEAVYSYEGTHEINSLIVGRALTGTSAFV